MTDAAIGLAALLRRVAAELQDAAQVCRRAEDLAASLAAEGGAALERLSPLQSLDELTQRLASLSAVLDEAAGQTPPDWSLASAPLMERVRLGQLASRLNGEPAAAAAPGEAEFF
jgi:hypothetical protein